MERTEFSGDPLRFPSDIIIRVKPYALRLSVFYLIFAGIYVWGLAEVSFQDRTPAEAYGVFSAHLALLNLRLVSAALFCWCLSRMAPSVGRGSGCWKRFTVEILLSLSLIAVALFLAELTYVALIGFSGFPSMFVGFTIGDSCRFLSENTELMAPDTPGETRMLIICFGLWVTSLFFLGGSLWRKYPFVKTALMCAGVLLLFTGLSRLVSWFGLGEMLTLGLHHHSTAASVALSLCLLSGVVFNCCFPCRKK